MGSTPSPFFGVEIIFYPWSTSRFPIFLEYVAKLFILASYKMSESFKTIEIAYKISFQSKTQN